jgi:methionyl aminopeptidase
VAENDGFYADATVTIRVGEVRVGEVSKTADELARCAERAFYRGLGSARAGNHVYEIGREVERETRRSGFSVIRDLCGYGVGRTIH